jgi:flagellar motility protein MotE (MotC chaperone)
MRFLQSTFFASLLGSLVFLGTSALLTIKGVASLPVQASEEHHGPPPDTKGPSWSFFNPEMDQIMSDLKTERDEMALREKQLNEMANRLRAEKAELDEALRSVKRIQESVDRSIIQIREDEVINLKRLAKMYATMEPPGAARILREIDDAIIVKILTLMKEPETAAILDAFARLGDPETKRAATLSETLRIATSSKPSSAKL